MGTERLNITKGDWNVNFDELPNELIVYSDFNNLRTATVFERKCNSFSESINTAISNAKLIADAGTTYNQCDKLPSELLAENKELLECLKSIESLIDNQNPTHVDIWSIVHFQINKSK